MLLYANSMACLNVLFLCVLIFNAILSPIGRALPIKEDTSKAGQDNVLNMSNQDKESQRIEKTNLTDNNKVGNAIIASANKSYDSSINDNRTSPIDISGLMESSHNKPKSEVPTDKKDTRHTAFTYHMKVINSSSETFQNKSILGESQTGTKTDSDNLHSKAEAAGNQSQNSKKLANNNTINGKDSGPILNEEDSDAKKRIVIVGEPETTENVINRDEDSPVTQERVSTVLGNEIGSDRAAPESNIQARNRDIASRYRLKSGKEFEGPTSRILVTVIRRSSRYWEPWELNRDVCPPSLCTASEESRPKGTGGSVFYNGDIVLDRESEEQIYGPYSERIRWKRAATRGSKRLWDDGIVPFTFSDVLPKSLRSIRKAMAHIEKHTCIRFRRKKLRDEDYIRFISEPGCWSNVGRVGGEQKVSIGRGCERLGTAIHEITHSLGFWHEQARPDRDKYVEILVDNVSPRYLPDFEPVNKTLVGSRGYPYDYESVMHYSKKAFTNLGEDTIEVIGIGKKLKMQIGQRDVLSNLDIAQLRDMYNCNDKEDNNVTLCPSGWKKKGRSCYKFITDLKYQFAAAAKHCEELNSHLLYIEDSTEDKFIKKRVKKKYPKVEVWRTGGRKFGKEFAWFRGEGKEQIKMEFTKWKKGHPKGYSSMALVHNRTADRVRWEGVWSGSASQYPEHAYPFICERRARRKCLKGNYPDGRDYRGKLDHTIDGITCQKWSSRYPHSHKLLPYPYKDTGKQDPDGLGDHNYCRNPTKNRKRRPWCFTDKKNIEWQYCDVSICSKKNPVKQTNSKTNTKTNSNKLTSEKANNKKDYRRNEIATGVKGSNKKNNEIQGDQGNKRQSNQNGKKKNNRNNSDSNSNGNTNKKSSTNRNRQTGDINTQHRHRNRNRRKDSHRENSHNNRQATGNRNNRNR